MAPRSGLASKHFIDTGAGVIDADYRGEVKVLLFNHSDVDFPGKFFGGVIRGEGSVVCLHVVERGLKTGYQIQSRKVIALPSLSSKR